MVRPQSMRGSEWLNRRKERWFLLTNNSLSYWEKEINPQKIGERNGKRVCVYSIAVLFFLTGQVISKFEGARGRLELTSITSADGPIEYRSIPYAMYVHAKGVLTQFL